MLTLYLGRHAKVTGRSMCNRLAGVPSSALERAASRRTGATFSPFIVNTPASQNLRLFAEEALQACDVLFLGRD